MSSTYLSQQQASINYLRLMDATDARRSARAALPVVPLDDDIDNEDSPCPIFDSFYLAQGNGGILAMTKFNSREFNSLFLSVQEHLLCKWNVGRGRKSTYTSKDVLFMTLTVLANGGTWDFLAQVFGLKGPSFEKLIVNFIKVISPYLYTKFVTTKLQLYTMENLVSAGTVFMNHPCALYATDVTFQQSNRPCGNIAESKPYYSMKHSLYGFKVEVSVLPNGFAANCTNHYRGGVSDIDIFRKNIAFHENSLLKSGTDSDLVDVGLMRDVYSTSWAVLCDKGYQGLGEVVRAIHPIKKPKNGFLTNQQQEFNRNVSSDRIVVENFFGRLCSLWMITSSKYRWSEDLYDPIFRMCVALTNIHIARYPLRADDSDAFNMQEHHLREIGETVAAKRKSTQQKYRQKRKRRLDAQFYAPDSPISE